MADPNAIRWKLTLRIPILGMTWRIDPRLRKFPLRRQNMLGHESAGLTLDRYGHLYGSDVEAVGLAINDLLTRGCGQNGGNGTDSAPSLLERNTAWAADLACGA